MAQHLEPGLLVGLDIGTAKVVCLVGLINEAENSIELVGIGSCPSKGLKKGVVVNIEATTQAIEQAVQLAEEMAGCQIHSVYSGVAGKHIESMNSHGVVKVKDSEVRQMDVQLVIEAAQAVAIPADRRVLHVLPQEFCVDGQEGIRDPRGMSGVRLEAKIHLVTCASNAAHNVEKCVRRCGLDVAELMLEPVASSLAVLADDEKELGVCLLDIGGGTTDIAVFTGGAIRFSSVIPVAGDQVTNDIAMALRTPIASAEKIKLQHGSAKPSQESFEQTIDVRGVGDRSARSLNKSDLCEVIEARYAELFELVKAELQENHYLDALPGGIVLTGGASKIEGLSELAEEVFELPIRQGVPQQVKGPAEIISDPAYSTSVGLLLYANDRQDVLAPDVRTPERFRGMFSRVKDWMSR